jgi:hypothetical protein
VANSKPDAIRRPKKSARTAATQAAFLAAFSRHGYVLKACKAAGITHSTPSSWERSDTAFAEAYAGARLAAIERLEMLCDKRAKGGSDTLLMFRLKKLDPSYREHFNVEQSGEVTNIIRIDAPPPPKPSE